MCFKPKKPKPDNTTQAPQVAIPEALPGSRVRPDAVNSMRGGFVSGADAFAFSGRASPFRISLFQERA